MRNIDYYLGRLLCLFLSWHQKLGAVFLKNTKIKEGKPNKILFVKMSEMGAIILSYHVIKKIKENYPEAELFFFSMDENREVLDLINLVSSQNYLLVRGHSFIGLVCDTIKNLFILRKIKIDIVYDLDVFTRYSRSVSYLCGAQIRRGFVDETKRAGYLGDLLTDSVNYDAKLHTSINYLKLVGNERNIMIRTLGELVKNYRLPKIVSSKESLAIITEKLKRRGFLCDAGKNIILLNHNASEKIPIRKWPLDNFILLAKKILDANHDNIIIMIGTDSDKLEAEKIKRKINNSRVIDFTGETTVRELIDLFNLSRLLITNDSGPAHFASLTDIKILDIFGPETPEAFSPISQNLTNFYANYFCSPCISIYNQKRTNCKRAACLEKIEAELVCKEALDYLSSH